MEEIRLNKKDAASQQLETTCLLFLGECDPVSIHTLANAAHDILMNLGKPKNITSILKEDVVKQLKLPDEKSFRKNNLNKARDFFKHADTDAEEVLNFEPPMNELLLHSAIRLYERLFEEKGYWMGAFDFYLILAEPGFYMGEDQVKKIESIRIKGKISKKVCLITRLGERGYKSFEEALKFE